MYFWMMQCVLYIVLQFTAQENFKLEGTEPN